MNTSSIFIPRVWAPEKNTVELIVQSPGSGDICPSELASPRNLPPSLAFSGEHLRLAMVSRPDGWWESPTALDQGALYGFCLDGGSFRPDPRSRFQPEGVHSWSQVWIPQRESTSDTDLVAPDLLGNVFYELHVGTFTPEGTFTAAATKLPTLRDLGIKVVELMPLSAFEGNRGWGYDSSDFFSPFAPYGTPQELTDFIHTAHRLGLSVCLDLVLNHASVRGCYLSEFGPYFSVDDTLWGGSFDIPTTSGVPSEPLEFLADCALWWLEAYGFDALRLDAIHAIEASRRKVLLDRISAQLPALEKSTGRSRTLIAESDLNDAGLLEELHLDGLWNDDFHHALHGLFTRESGGYYADFANQEAFIKVMSEVYFHNGTYSSFRDAVWGEPVPRELPREHFVVFSSNHDQVGNRPYGDRPASYLPNISVAALAALTLLSPFTPLLFMGEEFGAVTPFQFFANPQGKSDAIAIRDGRKKEFSRMWSEHSTSRDGKVAPLRLPDPTDIEVFQESKLDWSETETPRGQAFRRWYRDLLELRLRQKRGEFLLTNESAPLACKSGEKMGCTAPAALEKAAFPPINSSASWEGQVLVMRNAGVSVLVNFGESPLDVADSILEWGDYEPPHNDRIPVKASLRVPSQLVVATTRSAV